MEGGMNQPTSTMFFLKQRTTRIKKLCPCESPDNLAQDLIWSRKAEILNIRFYYGGCQTNRLNSAL